MATAGNFPKVVGDTIFLADYNAIQSVIAGVVNTYYGNALSSSQLSGTLTIAPAEWDNLRTDINKAYRHITNANSTVVDVASGGVIYKDDINAYKVAADYCETNKNTVAGAQLASLTTNVSITTAWNGNRSFIQSYIWPSEASATYWFNAGGYFVVDVSGSNSSGSAKDNDWQNNILNAIPTQTYTNTQWDAGTNIDVLEYGNVAPYYTENFCRIQIIKNSNTMLTVAIALSDADTGDAAVDEDVNTDAAASVTRYFSIDAITVTDPTPSVTSTW